MNFNSVKEKWIHNVASVKQAVTSLGTATGHAAPPSIRVPTTALRNTLQVTTVSSCRTTPHEVFENTQRNAAQIESCALSVSDPVEAAVRQWHNNVSAVQQLVPSQQSLARSDESHSAASPAPSPSDTRSYLSQTIDRNVLHIAHANDALTVALASLCRSVGEASHRSFQSPR